MNNEDLQKLKALALAATPGPWEATRQTDEECNFIGYFIEAGNKAISDDGTAPGHADALFIAAANPAAILAMIERIDPLAAPAVANAANSDELPPLPDAVMHTSIPYYDGRDRLYSADQMHAYARAAIAATAPNTALVEAAQRAYAYLFATGLKTKHPAEFQTCSYLSDKLRHALVGAGASIPVSPKESAHAGQGAKA